MPTRMSSSSRMPASPIFGEDEVSSLPAWPAGRVDPAGRYISSAVPRVKPLSRMERPGTSAAGTVDGSTSLLTLMFDFAFGSHGRSFPLMPNFGSVRSAV